jgi:hypothetical protein
MRQDRPGRYGRAERQHTAYARMITYPKVNMAPAGTTKPLASSASVTLSTFVDAP